VNPQRSSKKERNESKDSQQEQDVAPALTWIRNESYFIFILVLASRQCNGMDTTCVFMCYALMIVSSFTVFISTSWSVSPLYLAESLPRHWYILDRRTCRRRLPVSVGCFNPVVFFWCIDQRAFCLSRLVAYCAFRMPFMYFLCGLRLDLSQRSAVIQVDSRALFDRAASYSLKSLYSLRKSAIAQIFSILDCRYPNVVFFLIFRTCWFSYSVFLPCASAM